jgi:glycosyltransferase involved in cell wall biosynthesis
LFVESYPQALAGQQETLHALVGRAPGHGLAPTVAAPGDGAFLDRLRADGIAVAVRAQPATIGAYGGQVYRYGPAAKLAMALAVARYILRLRGWIARLGVQAVFCNDLRGLLIFGAAARLAGRPVVLWDKLDKPHGLYDWLQLPLASRNLTIADAVTAKYPRVLRRVYRRRIRRVPNGIAIARFRDADGTALRRGLGLGADDVAAAIVGSVTPRKGHDLLWPAFERARQAAPNLHLLVVGSTAAADAEFGRTLEARGTANVHWVGPRTDMPQVMAAIDILVSPSRHEGMGRVNVEAMAAGKPVVGSAGTGIAEVVVDGETGFLVDPTDTGALAGRLTRLAGDPDLRRRMGAAGRARAEAEFDADRQLAKVLDILHEVARR